MKAYMSFLKLLGIVLLIPLGFMTIGFLFTLGFGLDFNNAWSDRSSGGSSSMYMVVLPLGFIAVATWAIYTFFKRRSAFRVKAQETEIRQRVHRELDMGSNIHDVTVSMLVKYDGMTVKELSQKLKVSPDEAMAIIKELLHAGRVRQDIAQTPSRYYVK